MALNIVIIEDSQELCQGWQEVLSLDGHRVTCFLNGREALENRGAILQADVLITDYYLPDINGVKLITLVRKIREDIPVILLTGTRDPAIRESIRKVENSLFLSKPLRIEHLESGIQELLGRAGKLEAAAGRTEETARGSC